MASLVLNNKAPKYFLKEFQCVMSFKKLAESCKDPCKERNFRFSKTNIFFRSFNSVLYLLHPGNKWIIKPICVYLFKYISLSSTILMVLLSEILNYYFLTEEIRFDMP